MTGNKRCFFFPFFFNSDCKFKDGLSSALRNVWCFAYVDAVATETTALE